MEVELHPLEVEAEEIIEALRIQKLKIIPRRNSVRGSHGKRVDGQPHGRGPHRKTMTERELGKYNFNV